MTFQSVAKFSFILFISVAIVIVAAFTLLLFLRKLTHEQQARNNRITGMVSKREEWWRYLVPSVVTIVLAGTGANMDINLVGHVVWVILMGILLPIWMIHAVHQSSFEHHSERLAAIITMVLLLNAGFVSAGWSNARREQSEQYYGPARIVDYYTSGDDSQEDAPLKVELEWKCQGGSNGEYYCRDSRVLSCADHSGSDLRANYDYDMTIYNGDSFSCENGFTSLYNNNNNYNNNGNNNNNGGRRLEDKDEGDNKEEGEEGEEDHEEEEGENNSQDKEDEENNSQDNNSGDEKEDEEKEEENNNAANQGDGEQYASDMDGSPYMMTMGDCQSCRLDRHSGGYYYKAQKNTIMVPLWLASIGAAIATSLVWSNRRPSPALDKLESLRGSADDYDMHRQQSSKDSSMA